MPDAPHKNLTIADYLTVVRRYKWLILLTALVVPVVAFAFSLQQNKVYRASADVLLSRQDLASVLSGIPTSSTVVDPDRYARTQAELARTPTVADRALRSAGVVDMTPGELLASSGVGPRENTDLLAFAVDDQDGTRAALLTTAYAEAFTKYKLETDTASLRSAQRELQSRLRELRRAGGTDSDPYQALLQKSNDLRTLELLQAPATVVRPADGAFQIEPRPKRNAALGLMLGLLIGLGGAFLLNAFDRRIWHADDVEREIQIPLLAKLPTPRRNEAATILDRSSDATTEAVARLRASFDFANQTLGAKTVMVTSAGPREGKSTTISNLAISLARTGRNVVLVDLDLRRPMLSRMFHLPDGPGITDLASDSTELANVLQPVGVSPLRARVAAIGSDVGQGRLEVVTTGRTRVDPAAFVESVGLTEALRALRSHAEIVLIDAPPVLATGDSMALTGKVDAVLLVTRLGTLTRPTLQELARVLRRSPVPILGLVATGAEVDAGYSVYSVDEYYSQARPQPEVPAPAPARLEEVAPEARSASGGSTRWTPRRGG